MFKVVNHLMWLGGSFGCSCGKEEGESTERELMVVVVMVVGLVEKKEDHQDEI